MVNEAKASMCSKVLPAVGGRQGKKGKGGEEGEERDGVLQVNQCSPPGDGLVQLVNLDRQKVAVKMSDLGREAHHAR